MFRDPNFSLEMYKSMDQKTYYGFLVYNGKRYLPTQADRAMHLRVMALRLKKSASPAEQEVWQKVLGEFSESFNKNFPAPINSKNLRGWRSPYSNIGTIHGPEEPTAPGVWIESRNSRDVQNYGEYCYGEVVVNQNYNNIVQVRHDELMFSVLVSVPKTDQRGEYRDLGGAMRRAQELGFVKFVKNVTCLGYTWAVYEKE